MVILARMPYIWYSHGDDIGKDPVHLVGAGHFVEALDDVGDEIGQVEAGGRPGDAMVTVLQDVVQRPN